LIWLRVFNWVWASISTSLSEQAGNFSVKVSMNTSKLALVTPSKSSRIALILALESAHLAAFPVRKLSIASRRSALESVLPEFLKSNLRLRIQRDAFQSMNFPAVNLTPPVLCSLSSTILSVLYVFHGPAVETLMGIPRNGPPGA
jgi:hypothetical protein